ncbi:MAG: phosphohistidine phosphatase SixA [Planctomycetota bacterium]
MLLVVLRHADAEPTASSDAARRLTDKGRRQADRLAAYLQRIGLAADRVVTSPYARAVETARPIADALGAPLVEDDTLACGMAPEDAAALLAHECDPDDCVILVGHQPDCGWLLAWLCGVADSGNLAVKKGACAIVELDRPAAGEGVLRAFLPPKLLP